MKKCIVPPVLAVLFCTSSLLCIAKQSEQMFPPKQTSSTATPGTATPAIATPAVATPGIAILDSASLLIVPDEVTVYVDGSSSFDVIIQNKNGEELILSDDECLTVECGDGSVARAEVDGQTIYLVGVQSGSVELILHLQRKNESGNFEDVTFLSNGESKSVSAVVTVVSK